MQSRWTSGGYEYGGVTSIAGSLNIKLEGQNEVWMLVTDLQDDEHKFSRSRHS